ncbi:hypothetical protein EGR_03254 [Echinococcus granulosus]|uniref:Uncharacterized protein n=2 Tax=Echinococcus granulosus TaxID=6210 RepID=W6ULI2_ECHGR|nr:hypothetical protein EGR_03254 [Echinococcus granulosus]EUB61981.1 hypothetical protein EGR_03254 [Echinococcus granulosus]
MTRTTTLALPAPGFTSLWHRMPRWPGRMWFKINRRKLGDVGRQTSASLGWTKSKKGVKRFHWPSLRHPSVRRKFSLRRASPVRARAGVPPPPTAPAAAGSAFLPPRRIRCGTAVIPIMRASALHLPPPTAVKRRPTTVLSLEHNFLKVRRLSHRLEHFNPIYDEVCSDSNEEMGDEAIYEEITPPRKRTLVAPSYLDLMQVSAVVTDSPLKQLRPVSPVPSQGVYALHGGDWVSIASGIYDDVASSGNESDEEFYIDPCLDANIYDWAPDATDGARNIPWPTAAYGESAFIEDSMTLQWMHRESYVIQ